MLPNDDDVEEIVYFGPQFRCPCHECDLLRAGILVPQTDEVMSPPGQERFDD